MLFFEDSPEFFKSYLWNNLKTAPSFSQVFHEVKTAADLGEKEAQAYVGMCYEDGLGANFSFFEAFRYYKLSADQESVKGLRLLSHAYEKGIGVEPSYELFQKYGLEAMKKYQEKANQGNDYALFCLAQEFWEGCGFGVSADDTFVYLSNIVKTIDRSLPLLGLCYEDGIGTESNLNKAMELYLKSAKHKNPLAMFRAGILSLEKKEFADFRPEGLLYLRQILQDSNNTHLKEMISTSLKNYLVAK